MMSHNYTIKYIQFITTSRLYICLVINSDYNAVDSKVIDDYIL